MTRRNVPATLSGYPFRLQEKTLTSRTSRTSRKRIRLIHTSDTHLGDDWNAELADRALQSLAEGVAGLKGDALLLVGDVFDHARVSDANFGVFPGTDGPGSSPGDSAAREPRPLRPGLLVSQKSLCPQAGQPAHPGPRGRADPYLPAPDAGRLGKGDVRPHAGVPAPAGNAGPGWRTLAGGAGPRPLPLRLRHRPPLGPHSARKKSLRPPATIWPWATGSGTLTFPRAAPRRSIPARPWAHSRPTNRSTLPSWTWTLPWGCGPTQATLPMMAVGAKR